RRPISGHGVFVYGLRPPTRSLPAQFALPSYTCASYPCAAVRSMFATRLGGSFNPTSRTLPFSLVRMQKPAWPCLWHSSAYSVASWSRSTTAHLPCVCRDLRVRVRVAQQLEGF